MLRNLISGNKKDNKLHIVRGDSGGYAHYATKENACRVIYLMMNYENITDLVLFVAVEF